MTHSVAEVLKAAGVKGGWCNRLWTDEEVRLYETEKKIPKNQTITL